MTDLNLDAAAALMGVEVPKAFFYDTAELASVSTEDTVGDSADREMAFEIFGRNMLTKTILLSPNLSVFHATAAPGERVRPHSHGTHQLTNVLRGELYYGKHCTSAGMGRFQPDIFYSWTAGDQGAEFIEIHAGIPGVRIPSQRDAVEQP